MLIFLLFRDQIKFSSILGECTSKSEYLKCEICEDAVKINETETHKEEAHCRVLSSGLIKCGLCHENIYLPDDGGWERHFSIGCPMQKRKMNNN